VNFIEAIKEMEKGKIVSTSKAKYRICDGKFYIDSESSYCWSVSHQNITDLMQLDFKVERVKLKSLDELAMIDTAYFKGEYVEKTGGNEMWVFLNGDDGTCISNGNDSGEVLNLENWEFA